MSNWLASLHVFDTEWILERKCYKFSPDIKVKCNFKYYVINCYMVNSYLKTDVVVSSRWINVGGFWLISNVIHSQLVNQVSIWFGEALFCQFSSSMIYIKKLWTILHLNINLSKIILMMKVLLNRQHPTHFRELGSYLTPTHLWI